MTRKKEKRKNSTDRMKKEAILLKKINEVKEKKGKM